jgi:tripartite-type tricarboxylate transporter receptor subunit TctC
MTLPKPIFGVALVVAATSVCAAQNDPVADFYKGKTVNVYIGVAPGGENDLYARLVARHIGRHIPGNPNVVAQNMTGASGMNMVNFVYNQAPRDGTAIALVQNAFPAAQAIGRSGIKFDTTQMGWLGTISAVVETMTVWHSVGVRTIEDARKREVVAAATARGAITHFYPMLMNELLGTKFRVVTGYPGGPQMNLAMERGEVHSRNNTWSSWKATRPEWIAEKKIVILAQSGTRSKELDAPMLEDMVKTEADRQLIDVIMSGAKLGRPMATTPGVAEPRLRALRTAFLAVMKDPAFLKEAKQVNVEVDPVAGEGLEKIVAGVLATPKPVLERAKPLME